MQTVEIMEKTFDSESNDIALYLAMSRKAEEEGHHEIASYLLNVTVDEAQHVAAFAVLLGKIKDTRTNLVNMLASEVKTEKDRGKASKIAFTEGHEEAFQFFEKSMQDERKHKDGLRKVLSK